jgi:cell division protein FtsW
MGQTAYINTKLQPEAVKAPRSFRLKLDVPLTAVVLALLAIGALFVFSSSWQETSNQGGQVTDLLWNQVKFIFGGLVIASVVSLIDYHRYQRLIVLMLVGIVIALVTVLVVRNERNGAVRTLFGGSVQPVEFAKLVVILYMSFWLYSKREVLNNIFFGLIPMGVILGGVMGLIMLEPDISGTVTIFFLGCLMFFLAGGELRQIVLMIVIAVVVGYGVLSFSHTAQTRIGEFVAGLQDPENSSNHVLRSIEAIVHGGVFGVGIGRSTTKFTGLPFPWTDSIFAVITEETGFVGALAVICLYGIFLWRGLLIAKRAPDMLGRLLAASVSLWVTFEAVVNMSQMVNLLPFAGNALPLISYGGSNLISIMIAIGVLMNVARSSENEPSESIGRSYRAVVDLRRGNRRRRVSRPVGSEETGE